MTTKEFTHLAGQQTGTILNTRLLGTLGILGSSMLLVEGLYAGFQEHGTDQFIGLLEVIYMTAWMSSIAGLGLTKAAGKGWGGKTVLIIQLIGLMMAAAWSAIHLVVPNPDEEHILYTIGDIAWPFSHMFMNIVGIAVLRAKVWTGWRRFTPFWCGLALPAAMLTAVIAGEVALGIVFGLWTTAAFALLGYAVRTSREA
ncbi:MAG: hypothetical protein HS126_12540 [Anaerolineales bacterium]|nr:hypothetical protein [Anaerolineales bacterium]